MKSIRILLVTVAIFCITMLSGCEKDPPPVERKPDTLTYLKSFDIYDIGEHGCVVDTSTDSYKYQITLSDRDYYFLSNAKKIANNRVPIGIVDTMSTLGLMETILDNPVWYYTTVWGEEPISRFLSTDEKVGHFESMNPGLLDKFYAREDAASVLVERYTNMYPTCSENNYSSGFGDGDYLNLQLSTTFMEIQLLMAEDSILNQLTEGELRELSIHVIKTYISLMEKYPNKDIYMYNLLSLAWLATRIMETNGYQPFYNLYGVWHKQYMSIFCKLLPLVGFNDYAQLMLCLNDFIQEEI